MSDKTQKAIDKRESKRAAAAAIRDKNLKVTVTVATEVKGAAQGHA